jgi:hypothetical protein
MPPVQVAEIHEKAGGFQKPLEWAEAGGLVMGKDLRLLDCSGAAFAAAERRLHLKMAEKAVDCWCNGDFEASVLGRRCTVDGNLTMEQHDM